jgi:hypothetical protein
MFDIPARTIIHYCSEKGNLENVPVTPAIELFKKYRAMYDDAVQDRHLKVFRFFIIFFCFFWLLYFNFVFSL